MSPTPPHPVRKIPVCDCQYCSRWECLGGGVSSPSLRSDLSLESYMRTSLCHLPDRSLEGWHLQVLEHWSVLKRQAQSAGRVMTEQSGGIDSSSALQLPSTPMLIQTSAQPACSLCPKLLRGFEEKGKSYLVELVSGFARSTWEMVSPSVKQRSEGSPGPSPSHKTSRFQGFSQKTNKQKTEQNFKGVTWSKRTQYHNTELNTHDKHTIVIKIVKKTIDKNIVKCNGLGSGSLQDQYRRCPLPRPSLGSLTRNLLESLEGSHRPRSLWVPNLQTIMETVFGCRHPGRQNSLWRVPFSKRECLAFNDILKWC